MQQPLNKIDDLEEYLDNFVESETRKISFRVIDAIEITKKMSQMDYSELKFTIMSLVKVFESSNGDDDLVLYGHDFGIVKPENLYFTLTSDLFQMRLWKGPFNYATHEHIDSMGKNLLIHFGVQESFLMGKYLLPIVNDLGYTDQTSGDCLIFRKPSSN